MRRENEPNFEPKGKEQVDHEVKICFLAHYSSEELYWLLPQGEREHLTKYIKDNYTDETGAIDVNYDEWLEVQKYAREQIKLAKERNE